MTTISEEFLRPALIPEPVIDIREAVSRYIDKLREMGPIYDFEVVADQRAGTLSVYLKNPESWSPEALDRLKEYMK